MVKLLKMEKKLRTFFVNVRLTLPRAIPPVAKSLIESIKENIGNCLHIRPVTEIEIVNIIND